MLNFIQRFFWHLLRQTFFPSLFDEIGSVLKIKEYQETKKELLEALELYYRTFFLGENVDWEEEKESQEDENKGEADEI